MMAPLRWISGLVLAASLVSCAPQPVADETTAAATTPDPASATAAAPAEDIASQFVSDLIANATQADEEQSQEKRSLFCTQDSLTVNLGYAKYRGYNNASTGLNYWKGVRYAAPPTGKLRWQPPRALPLVLNAPITEANAFGPICPQSMPAVPGAPFIPGNEDCLYLNVYAPANAANLPVLVYIHEGGYGMGDGTHDMTDIINANDKGFVAVTIQYRLGAFGWLSSGEVKQNGAVNAGMLDQAMALAWVKLYICQFGGDPSQITIAGESAGGGSVLYHGVALKGNLGNLLYKQGIAASPYLPFHYKYNDAQPTAKYYAFSEAVGCPSSGNVFDCLVGKDTDTLQQANYAVTQATTYGYWAFWPVTDNSYILGRPSQQLAAKKMNGDRLLVGHNANEGGLFVPPFLTTPADLTGWLQNGQFPNLTPAQINTILAANPNDANTDAAGLHFETDGVTAGATAVQYAQDANGQQQRGNNIYAEAVFACPAYWLASSYATTGSASYLYQYSVPYAYHGADVGGYFGPQTPNQSNDFVKAFRKIWGNFIRTGNPSITAPIANGAGAANPNAAHPATNWPAWSDSAPKLMNLNTTGGVAVQAPLLWGPIVTQYVEPGLKNAISLASATTWEGGRKARCDVYMGLGASIPL